MTIPPWNELLLAAQMAPSGDNCQPWLFSVQGRLLRIAFDKSVDAHFMNVNSHASLISLGCVLEILNIVGQHLGWKYERSSIDRTDHTVTLHFYQSEPERHMLYEYVFTRATYRGPFKKNEETERLKDLASQIENSECRIHILSGFSNPFSRRLATFDSRLWHYDAFRTDLLKWIHLSHKAWNAAKDGFIWNEICLTKADLLPLKLMKKSRWIRNLLWRPSSWKACVLYKKWLKNSAGIAFFSTQKSDDEAFLNVGSIAYRFWLHCLEKGWAVQPLTSISLLNWEISQQAVELNAPDRRLGQDIYQELHDLLGLQNKEPLLWALRVGEPEQDASRISLRRRPAITSKDF